MLLSCNLFMIVMKVKDEVINIHREAMTDVNNFATVSCIYQHYMEYLKYMLCNIDGICVKLKEFNNIIRLCSFHLLTIFNDKKKKISISFNILIQIPSVMH